MQCALHLVTAADKIISHFVFYLLLVSYHTQSPVHCSHRTSTKRATYTQSNTIILLQFS